MRTNRTVYPEGWELIEPTLRELESKMREGAYSSLSLSLSLSLSEVRHHVLATAAN